MQAGGGKRARTAGGKPLKEVLQDLLLKLKVPEQEIKEAQTEVERLVSEDAPEAQRLKESTIRQYAPKCTTLIERKILTDKSSVSAENVGTKGNGNVERAVEAALALPQGQKMKGGDKAKFMQAARWLKKLLFPERAGALQPPPVAPLIPCARRQLCQLVLQMWLCLARPVRIRRNARRPRPLSKMHRRPAPRSWRWTMTAAPRWRATRRSLETQRQGTR